MKSGWKNYFLVSVSVAEQLAACSISDMHGKRRAFSQKANLAKNSVAVTDFYQLRAGTIYRYNAAFMIFLIIVIISSLAYTCQNLDSG